MNLRLLTLAACAVCSAGVAAAAEAAAPQPPASLMIADFEEPDVLSRIVVTKSASVSISDQDAVSGKHSLEVHVKPFSTHGDQWPYVFLIDTYFTTPLDLSRYSRVVASVRNVTEGLATVQFTLSSKPYNDGGRNLEGRGFVIPGGSTMQCALPTTLFERPMNDPSSVQALMFVFPPNETDAVYRIDAIQAVYDPVLGSPAETLAKKLTTGADGLLTQVEGLERQVNWAAVPAERAAALRRRIPELAATVRELQQRAEVAAREGWKGAYNANREALDAIARSLGEFAVADKTGFHLWQRPRYSYARRDALPTFASPVPERLDLEMAQNEFRDATWMVTACGREVQLQAEVTSTEPGLADAVQLRWSDFVTPAGLSEYADVLVPLTGTLTIPAGESRELWATFDTRWHSPAPGRHELRLQLRDLASGASRMLPVSLTVWDFALPSYDVLPNNAYVEYHNSEVGAQVPDEGVRHMKMYGVNMTYVLPNELPLPAQVDAQFNLTAFDAAALTQRITRMLQAWRAAPGQERLQWVFALSGIQERLLADPAVKFLSEPWKRVFVQWLQRFRDAVRAAGIADEDWLLVLADESSESALTTYEIPFAELIKSVDSRVRLTCNASQVINDPALAARFFRAFDVLQPCLDALKQSPELGRWIGVNQRPLWTYRCQAMAGLDKNLYDYYRVYAWENLSYGISGTGIWTYCAQGETPWGTSQRGIAYNLVFKHRERAEIVHSRRYEFYREGLDDYRYVQALVAASRKAGGDAEAKAQALVREATADIMADPGDVTRCERWRQRLAARVLELKGAAR